MSSPQVQDVYIGSNSDVKFVIDYVRLFDSELLETFEHLAADYTDGRLWQQRIGDLPTDGLLFVMDFDRGKCDGILMRLFIYMYIFIQKYVRILRLFVNENDMYAIHLCLNKSKH